MHRSVCFFILEISAEIHVARCVKYSMVVPLPDLTVRFSSSVVDGAKDKPCTSTNDIFNRKSLIGKGTLNYKEHPGKCVLFKRVEAVSNSRLLRHET